MGYTNDAYVTLLLTMALSPNREEYVSPYTTSEFRKLEEKVRKSELRTLGRLHNIDISGMTFYLGISEEEGFRIFSLLNRSVQLTYSMENFLGKGIEVVSEYNDSYPARLSRRMGLAAPPFYYQCGAQELLARPAIAIMGISGVKTTPEVRDGVVSLVKSATEHGFAVLTGGELGVSRVAASAVKEYGGWLIDVLGGNMYEHIEEPTIASLLSAERALVLSLEHPEALFTIIHAANRNKVLFAMADAAFVFNTDMKRGESEAINNHYCEWIYAWSGYPANTALISRGATPIADMRAVDFDELSRYWRGSQSEQLNMFDWL